jgi:hypothetical protein
MPRLTRSYFRPAALLTFIVLALAAMPAATYAQATKHFRATFVAESNLAVTGKAEVQIDANNVAHIVIHISGLLPGETFPAHIHEGATIDNPGNILVALPDLVANAAGVATLVTTLSDADKLDLANRTIGVHLSDGTRIAKGGIDPVGG